MGFKNTREIDRRCLPHNEKAVLRIMGELASDLDGTGCFASQETIGAKAGYSDRTVRKIQKRLAQRGAIQLEGKHRQHKTDCWRVVFGVLPYDLRLLRMKEKNLRPEISSGLESIADHALNCQTGSLGQPDRNRFPTNSS